MSDFSEKCKWFLVESGSNVYQLSQTFGLDRTTLQRMTTGKRLPSIDFVMKFCKYIRLNALQKKELIELYQMDKLGKAVYNNRKCIHHILTFLDHLETPPYATRTVFSTSAWVKIASYLELCFQSHQDLTIYSNLPPNCISFFDSLKNLRLKYEKSLPVKHIFAMQSNPSAAANVNSNLELLYTILPMVLSGYENYDFYYYYSKTSATDWDLSLFPHYIIADTTVILISSDLADVLYLTEATHVQPYIAQFEHSITLCEPLLTQSGDITEVAADYANSYTTTGIPRYALESHPCVATLIDSNQFFHELDLETSPIHTKLVDFLLTLRKHFLQRDIPFDNFFTLEGLDHFVNTGCLGGHYDAFGLCFTPDLRIRMLKNLMQGDSKFYRPFLLKDKFPCGSNVHLEVYDDLRVRILYLNPAGQFYSLLLTENSIGYALQDFFDSLSESEQVYTTSELHSILNTHIQQLEQLL